MFAPFAPRFSVWKIASYENNKIVSPFMFSLGKRRWTRPEGTTTGWVYMPVICLNKFEAFEYGHLDCPIFFVSPRTYELAAYMFHGKTHRLWKVPRWITESPFFSIIRWTRTHVQYRFRYQNDIQQFTWIHLSTKTFEGPHMSTNIYQRDLLGGGFQYSLFSPLTMINIFQRGWNHSLVCLSLVSIGNLIFRDFVWWLPFFVLSSNWSAGKLVVWDSNRGIPK